MKFLATTRHGDMMPGNRTMSDDEKHHHHHRFSSEEKIQIVMRSLGGESRDALAEELGIPVDRLEAWESIFVNAGSKALSARHRREASDRKVGSRIAQWSILLLVLLAVVYFLTRFMESSGE